MSEKKLPPFISIIALTHNDKENLSTLLQRIAKTLESYRYELIIVDDNGTDGMAEEAEILCRQYPVKFIDSKDRRGFASAVIAGFNLARGEILGLINTDQQHPPEKIPELLQAIENGADIAVASRYSSGSGIESRNKKGEDIFPRATMLARLALPSVRNVRDPMSGFFLLKRKVLDGVVLKPGYKILPQVLATGGGNEVIEVPYIENIVKQKGALQFRGQLDYLWNFLFLATKERELWRFIQFCLVGLSGVGVNIGIFWFFTRIVGLSEPYDLIALILGIVASIISNFILNDIWTFRDRRIPGTKAALLRAFKFNIVSVGALVIYYAIYTPLTRFTGIYDLVALLIAVGVGLIWNFGINILWTWRKKEVQVIAHT